MAIITLHTHTARPCSYRQATIAKCDQATILSRPRQLRKIGTTNGRQQGKLSTPQQADG